jgi:hypothetical protein
MINLQAQKQTKTYKVNKMPLKMKMMVKPIQSPKLRKLNPAKIPLQKTNHRITQPKMVAPPKTQLKTKQLTKTAAPTALIKLNPTKIPLQKTNRITQPKMVTPTPTVHLEIQMAIAATHPTTVQLETQQAIMVAPTIPMGHYLATLQIQHQQIVHLESQQAITAPTIPMGHRQI